MVSVGRTEGAQRGSASAVASFDRVYERTPCSMTIVSVFTIHRSNLGIGGLTFFQTLQLCIPVICFAFGDHLPQKEHVSVSFYEDGEVSHLPFPQKSNPLLIVPVRGVVR